jgi:hypothetical protein
VDAGTIPGKGKEAHAGGVKRQILLIKGIVEARMHRLAGCHIVDKELDGMILVIKPRLSFHRLALCYSSFYI